MILWDQKQRCVDWMSQWMSEKMADDHNRQAIGYEKDGKLIAAVTYSGFTGYDIEMGLLTAGRVPPGFVKAVFSYPFNQLNCRRVTAEVASKNSGMLNLMERFGFRREGVKKDALPEDDYIVFGMTRSECKYL